MKRIASLAVTMVLALTGVGLVAPATSALDGANRVDGVAGVAAKPVAKTKIKLKKPRSTPPVGGTVMVRGKKSKGSRSVVIRQRTAGGWTKVAKVSTKKRKFATPVHLTQRVTTLRAVAKKRTTKARTYKKSKSAPIHVWAAESPAVVSEAAAAARNAINAYRLTQGISKLAGDNVCLAQFAGDHSRAMVEHNAFKHSNDPYWKGRTSSFIEACKGAAPGGRGEILAEVYGNTPAAAAVAAVEAWIQSPPHEAILSHSSGTGYQLGIGVFRGPGGTWWFTGVLAWN